MPPAGRPFAALPPGAADVLRPVLPALADETIEAIAREAPGYARAMEGSFGQAVRVGVEVAFNRFVDLLVDPGADLGGGRDTYVDLGRGEFHAGRSLDALLAAYRVGARLTWRRFVEAGTRGGLPPALVAGQADHDYGVSAAEGAGDGRAVPGEEIVDATATRLARRVAGGAVGGAGGGAPRGVLPGPGAPRPRRA